ncbi:hypothetical protein HPOKI102_03875 [Helicobacter pylori oki102]|nr:hypothetical protein HPOKI102_03875 [Helicobacter pylori oki102]
MRCPSNSHFLINSATNCGFFKDLSSFFFFDLILSVIVILLKRKSYESNTKHH